MLKESFSCCYTDNETKCNVYRGEWRKLHIEELNDLYTLPNIVRVINSRRMRWAGHVARRGGEERPIQGFGGERETQA
jgi:hypothetical protein